MPETENSPSTLAARLAQALEIIATDLTLMSESYYPYKAFHLPFAKDAELTTENFLAAANLHESYREISARDADAFFDERRDPDTYDNPEERAAYRLLGKIMKATLADLSVFYVSSEDMELKPEVRFFLFGRMKDGSLAGLQSTSIQT